LVVLFRKDKFNGFKVSKQTLFKHLPMFTNKLIQMFAVELVWRR